MSADQETRLWLTQLRDDIAQQIRAALPFVRDGKLDLSSKNIVGTVPPANGGSGTNTGAEPALGNPAANGDVLSSTTSGVRSWVSPGLTNPMTTQDDLIVGGVSGTPARLAKGADSQVLTVDPTTHHLVWTSPASGFADPTTTKGDLIVHGASTTRLAVGSDGQVLTADSTQAAGVKWAATSGSGALTQIARTVLGAAAASITFSSIPGTHSDLLLVWQLNSASTSTVRLRFNGDTAGNYNWAFLDQENNSMFGGESYGDTSINLRDATSFTTSGTTTIANYAGTTFQKDTISSTAPNYGNSTLGSRVQQEVGRWKSTAAITSITLFLASGGNFATGSAVSLYGLG